MAHLPGWPKWKSARHRQATPTVTDDLQQQLSAERAIKVSADINVPETKAETSAFEKGDVGI